MGWTDTGIYRHGQLLQGKSTLYPTHLGYAQGSDTFVGTETALGSEVIRKTVSWTNSGLYSLYTSELSSLEANGSNIKTVGLSDNSAIGSGNLWTYDESFIGSKNNSFNVQVEGEAIFRRPT